MSVASEQLPYDEGLDDLTINQLGAVVAMKLVQEDADNESPKVPERALASEGDPSDLLHQYLKEIGKIPLLDAGEEVDLAKRIEVGLFANHKLVTGQVKAQSKKGWELGILKSDGEAAKRQMVAANLRLVVSVAKKYPNSSSSVLLDNVQEGNIGLIRAVEKFDYAKGYKFSTYATWWIRQAISKAIPDLARNIRIPTHEVEQVNKLVRRERALTSTLGRAPTLEDLAVALEIPIERVRDLYSHIGDTVSLQMPANTTESSSELGEFIEGDEVNFEEVVEAKIMGRELRIAVKSLPERERDVIALVYGLADGKEYTRKEIGRRLGVSPATVHNIETKALNRLRKDSKVTSLPVKESV